MLDPQEQADFEAWKAEKLTTSVDLSVSAYNLELQTGALAYEEGVRAAFAGAIVRKSQDEVIAENPYRKPGMLGGPSIRKITT